MNDLPVPTLVAVAVESLQASVISNFASYFILPIIAGLIGSFAMASLMLVPARMGWFRVDVVRAVGAFVTRDRGSAFVPGIIIHVVVGALVAVFYKWFFDYMGIPLFWVTGLFAGAVHGVLVMLVVSIFVLEHHPMKRYQRRGFGTGISQIFGHAFYGLIVGLLIGAFTLENHFWPRANDLKRVENFGR